MEFLITEIETYWRYFVLISAILGVSYRFWVKRIKPRTDKFDMLMLLLEGREAVSLPEAKEIVVNPALPNALVRLVNLESSDRKLAMGLDELNSKLDLVVHEVLPNNGDSLRDSIDQQNVKLDEQNVKLDEHLVYSEEIVKHLSNRLEQLEEREDNGN